MRPCLGEMNEGYPKPGWQLATRGLISLRRERNLSQRETLTAVSLKVELREMGISSGHSQLAPDDIRGRQAFCGVARIHNQLRLGDNRRVVILRVVR